jgi:hypothetical protein
MAQVWLWCLGLSAQALDANRAGLGPIDGPSSPNGSGTFKRSDASCTSELARSEKLIQQRTSETRKRLHRRWIRTWDRNRAGIRDGSWTWWRATGGNGRKRLGRLGRVGISSSPQGLWLKVTRLGADPVNGSIRLENKALPRIMTRPLVLLPLPVINPEADMPRHEQTLLSKKEMAP